MKTIALGLYQLEPCYTAKENRMNGSGKIMENYCFSIGAAS